MPSTDRLYHYMLYRGAEPAQANDTHKAMLFMCELFGLEPIPGSKATKKKIFSALRQAIELGDEITKEKLVVVAQAVLCREGEREPDDRDLALARSRTFYQSPEWRFLRIQALSKRSSCEACGASPATGAVLHVDHILPRSIYPQFALSLNNLQILCESCNMGKGNVVTTNFKRRNANTGVE